MKQEESLITSHKIVFLFSGQGSHYRGMGEVLYKNNAIFARSLNQSAELIGQQLGISLIEELYERKEKDFDDLLFTHPAIVAVELAMLDLIQSLGITPDYVSGNSLGEFAAATVAGIWTKEAALEAAIEQAKSIVQSGVEGGMVAVINESQNKLKPLLDKLELYVASENFPNHFTVSGAIKKLAVFQKELDRQDLQFLRLPVKFPFHSPLIPEQTDFLYYLYTSSPTAKPQKGFISGIYNQEMKELPADYFWKVVSQPTNFCQFVKKMEELGPCLYLDLGPSGTSATFVKYNLPETSNSITHSIMTPYKRETAQLKALENLFKTIV